MEEVIVYKTSDGQIFVFIEDAIKRQKEIDFRKWYEENNLCGSYEGARVTSFRLISWLIENKEEILKLLE